MYLIFIRHFQFLWTSTRTDVITNRLLVLMALPNMQSRKRPCRTSWKMERCSTSFSLLSFLCLYGCFETDTSFASQRLIKEVRMVEILTLELKESYTWKTVILSSLLDIIFHNQFAEFVRGKRIENMVSARINGRWRIYRGTVFHIIKCSNYLPNLQGTFVPGEAYVTSASSKCQDHESPSNSD